MAVYATPTQNGTTWSQMSRLSASWLVLDIGGLLRLRQADAGV